MKFLSKIITVGVILILLAGCAKPPVNNKVTVEFWTLQLSNFAPYINRVITEYEASHPDVKIKWIDVPFSEGEKRALASVMSKNVPDLINMNPSFGTTLASRGALINLRDYITKQDYDKYLKESWDASTLNDVTFGIPWYITSSVTIYNKDLFKQAGIDVSNPPQTYEELGNIAAIIKQKTGKYAFMPTLTEDGAMLKIFNKYDIPIVNENRTKALFNTPKAVNVLGFWVNLYNNKLIPPESLTQGHRDAIEKFQAGESALILTGANFLKIIKENAPQVYKVTDVAPQITGSNHKADFSVMNLVVPVKSSHKAQAIDFALFLTNTKNQLEFSKLAPVLPSTIEGLGSDRFKKANSTDLFEKANIISAKQLNKALKPIPPLENHKDLAEIIDFATQSALLQKKTPKQALDFAEKEWDKLLKK